MAAFPVPHTVPWATLGMAPAMVQDAVPAAEPGSEPALAASVPLPAAGSAEQTGGDQRAADPLADGESAGDLSAGGKPVSDQPAGDRPTRRADTARTGPWTAIQAAFPKAVPRSRAVRAALARSPAALEMGNPDAPRRQRRPPANDPAEERIPGSAPEKITSPVTVAIAAHARAARPGARRPTPRPSAARAESDGEASAMAGPPNLPDPPAAVDPVAAVGPPQAPGPARAPDSPGAVDTVAAADPPAAAGPAEPADPSTSLSSVVITSAEGMPQRSLSRPAAHPEPPAPVVNVTIGRVEVRQPPAPAPPPPVPAALPQPMSLDEYLDRRNRSLP